MIPDSALELDALPSEREALRVVPIDEIRPNPEQPRTEFDRAALDELAASIRTHGILSPLLVRKTDGHYVVIAGERRLRAAALAGLSEVPVVVREADAPSHQLELALVENLQRSDLDPIESARGFQRLLEEYGYTQDRVAGAVGKDRSTVANLVRLLKLPAHVLDAVRDGRISAGHARALLPLAEEESLPKVLAQIVDNQLNVRQTERLANELSRVPTVQAVEKKAKDRRQFEYVVKLLEDALHTSVAVKPSAAGGGRIVIDYSDGEDLERLLGLLQSGKP
ncbi:MAG: ParB/RepB/Spo0J family partition protein [Myxococcota bacterium]